MKDWISASSSLALANRHCRRASATNSGECTSGTQIWIGRIPWARNRWRCSRTLGRLAARRASWAEAADALGHRSTQVGILKVVQPGLDQLPEVEGLGPSGQLRKLIEPLLGCSLQPHCGGHAVT
jgi:hypothetical protein